MNNLKNKFFFEIICPDAGVDQMCVRPPPKKFFSETDDFNVYVHCYDSDTETLPGFEA